MGAAHNSFVVISRPIIFFLRGVFMKKTPLKEIILAGDPDSKRQEAEGLLRQLHYF